MNADSDPLPERAALNNLALALTHAVPEIRRSHDIAEPNPISPAAARAGGVSGSDQAVPATHARPRTPPVGSPLLHTYRDDVAAVRRLVMWYSQAAGLSEGRAADLVLAVSEVAANTLRHTDSSGELAIWHDEREIVCEIHDQGQITDPQAGRRRPPADALGGHGLWLVYQVCDLVELRSDTTGTTIRMHMNLGPGPRPRGPVLAARS